MFEKNHISRFTVLLFFIVLIISSSDAFAGGIFIDNDNLLFNNQSNQREFAAKDIIELSFKYDGFVYAGKPFIYIVFVIYQKDSKDSEHKVGMFVSLIHKDNMNGKAFFNLPEPGNNYCIKFYTLPYLSFDPLPVDALYGFINKKDIKKIENYYNAPENGHNFMYKLVDIKSILEKKNDELALYFNNPFEIKSKIDAGEPLSFSWFNGPESSRQAKNVKYSFRLDPVEDWTIYSEATSTTYNYLRPGNYSFQVKAKYTINGVEKESPVAVWEFKLKKEIFGLLSKKEITTMADVKELPTDFFDMRYYSESRALIIGVKKYDDSIHFAQLPYVENDVKKVLTALSNFHFKTEVLNNGTTKQHIQETMEDLLSNSKENDRVILYFSGHGASIGERCFLVCSDSSSENKEGTCISFSYLESWIKKMMDKKIKHLLVILDSCQSGLGVLSKSSQISNVIELSKYPSAHVLTAGLMGQDAQIDTSKGMSIFSMYLVDGLSGKADYTKDNIITLTELLLYVQDNVSKYSEQNFNENQTPVMGKVKGAGEMLFLLK